MVLRLYQFEIDRLPALLGGRGNPSGKGIYPKKPNQVIITAEQVEQIKELFENGMTYIEIEQKTELSQYFINGVSIGRYDWLIE